MYDRNRLSALLSQRLPGHNLPQQFYTDPDIYAFDLHAIFFRSWIMVGFEAELAHPGAYLATAIGNSPIVVLRDRRGEIVGFHNICRHRGAQICKTGSGTVTRLVCPYHQWTYTLDGKLAVARGAGDDFDLTQLSLTPIRIELVAGCIYVALSEAAPDFSTYRRVLEPALRPHNLSDLKVAHVVELSEQANWKLVMENAHECNHCVAGHPEFKNVFPLELLDGGNPFPDSEARTPFMQRMQQLGFETAGHSADWWKTGRIRLSDGFASFSIDGKPLVNKRLNDANGGELGTFRWAAEPNDFCHVTSDMCFTFTANPTGPLTTAVTARWLVHKDAVEGVDYDRDRLISLWDKTNRQDQKIVENNQRGINSVSYQAGPYTPEKESYVMEFMDWYCAQAARFLQTA